MVPRLDDFGRLIASVQSDDLAEEWASYRAYAEKPGPVVCLVGAAGRGKSELVSRLADPDESAAVVSQFAGAGSWWAQQGAAVHGLGSTAGSPGPLLLTEVPASLLTANGTPSSEAPREADVILMVVQLTQPTGFSEITYAKEHLSSQALDGRVPVLVLTKADLVDEEDFADASEAIWAAYRDIAWRQVTIAGRGVSGDQLFDLPVVQSWWATEGIALAMKARRQRLALRGRRLLSRAEQLLLQRKEEATGALEARSRFAEVRKQLQAAQEHRDRVRHCLLSMAERAEQRYSGLLPELRAAMEGQIQQVTAEIGQGRSVEDLDATFEAIYEHWDRNARSLVRREMATDVSTLESERSSLLQALASASALDPEAVSIAGSIRKLERDEIRFLSPRLTLSGQERSKAHLVSGMAGLGAILVASLLGSPLSGAILATSLAVNTGVRGQMLRSRQEALCREARAALEEQTESVEGELLARFREDWAEWVLGLEEQLSPLERALQRALLRQAAEEPGEEGSGNSALLQQQRETDALLAELRALRQEWDDQETRDDGSDCE